MAWNTLRALFCTLVLCACAEPSSSSLTCGPGTVEIAGTCEVMGGQESQATAGMDGIATLPTGFLPGTKDGGTEEDSADPEPLDTALSSDGTTEDTQDTSPLDVLPQQDAGADSWEEEADVIEGPAEDTWEEADARWTARDAGWDTSDPNDIMDTTESPDTGAVGQTDVEQLDDTNPGDAVGEDSLIDDASPVDEDGSLSQACDPSGVWDILITSAALPGEGCQDGNPGQAPSPHGFHIVKLSDTGELDETLLSPLSMGGGVIQTLEIVEVNGLEDTTAGIAPGCAIDVIMTAKIFLPPFFEDDEPGYQVAQYTYRLYYDDTFAAAGWGNMHIEFQAESGAIEGPCTEAIAGNGSFLPESP